MLIHNFCSLQVLYHCLADVLMLAVPHGQSVMNEPNSPGGPVKLFVSGEKWQCCDSFWFQPYWQSFVRSAQGDSEHVFVYPVYQLPIFIVSPACLVRCGSGSRIQQACLRWRCLSCRIWRSYRCPHPAASDVLGSILRLWLSALLATIAFSKNCHRSPSGLLIHRVACGSCP